MAAGGHAKPRTYGRYFVFKCPTCGLISAATLTNPKHQLCCLTTGHPHPLRGCGKKTTFNKAICKVGLRPIKEGDAPLTMTEGFKDLADTVEAVREMREAQDGGVLVTAEEQEELEAALEDEDEAGGGGGGGGGAGGGVGGGGRGKAGTSNPNAAAMDAAQMAEKRKKEAADDEAWQAAAAADDVEVELSQKMGDLTSPSKSPPPKKPKKGGDGGSSSQAIEFSP